MSNNTTKSKIPSNSWMEGEGEIWRQFYAAELEAHNQHMANRAEALGSPDFLETLYASLEICRAAINTARAERDAQLAAHKQALRDRGIDPTGIQIWLGRSEF